MSEKWGRRLLVPFIFGAFLLMGTLEEVLAQDDNFKITWNFPVERIDDTALALDEIISTKIYCDGLLVEEVDAPVRELNAYLSGGEHGCYGIVIAYADDVGGTAINSEASPTITFHIPVKLAPAKPLDGLAGSLL